MSFLVERFSGVSSRVQRWAAVALTHMARNNEQTREALIADDIIKAGITGATNVYGSAALASWGLLLALAAGTQARSQMVCREFMVEIAGALSTQRKSTDNQLAAITFLVALLPLNPEERQLITDAGIAVELHASIQAHTDAGLLLLVHLDLIPLSLPLPRRYSMLTLVLLGARFFGGTGIKLHQLRK